MFEQEEIELTIELLNHILNRNSDGAFTSAKKLFELFFGKNFAREVENNGVLRHKSLTGPEDNIHYFGILYENAPRYYFRTTAIIPPNYFFVMGFDFINCHYRFQ